MTGVPPVTISVLDFDDLAPALGSARWHQVSEALAPQRLVGQGADPQWSVSCVVAECESTMVGLLPMWRSRRERFASGLFDPEQVAPAIFEPGGRRAGDYLLIGGATRLVAGYSTLAGADRARRLHVGQALTGGAFAEAAARGLVGAALYVRDEQLGAFVGAPSETGRTTVEIAAFSEIRLPGADLDSYLATLSHGRRSVVRRDLGRLSQLGLQGVPLPASEVVDEAAPLVVACKARHDVPDHPRLAAMRLRQWSAETYGLRLAFAVRSPGGELLAVSFGCLYDDVLELFEIGLADSEHRQLAYVEALVYAPLRTAIEHGCRVLQLGLGASRPKMLRGAAMSPVWAVAGPGHAAPDLG